MVRRTKGQCERERIALKAQFIGTKNKFGPFLTLLRSAADTTFSRILPFDVIV